MLWNKIKSLVSRFLSQPQRDPSIDGNSLWCVIANVVAEHPVGENKEIRKGTKHFSAGTKVYCYPPLWGDGYEKIKVIGRHRRSHQVVEIVTRSKWLTNWRVKMVYSPNVVNRMKGHWDDSKESEKKAKSIVAEMKSRVANRNV